MPSTVAQPPLVIVLAGRLDPEPCTSLIRAVSAAVTSGRKEVHLLMRSLGGYVEESIALYNTLRALPISITAHNTYGVSSMGVVVFLAADQRYAANGSTFTFHRTALDPRQIALSVETARDVADEAAHIDNRVVSIVAERTPNDAKVVSGWLAKGRQFEAPEALEVGLVQRVGVVKLPAKHDITVI